jgi:mannose-6-phosphate isomerase class I
MDFRKTSQRLMPARQPDPQPGEYAIYPGYPLSSGKIAVGFDALAEWIGMQRTVVLDGFTGVLWHDLRHRLAEALAQRGLRSHWIQVDAALKPPEDVERLVKPFLGGDDPIFGTRFTGSLSDFFDPGLLANLAPDPQAAVNILYGCGAALAGWRAALAYVDLPKNELQFRARAGRPTNIGVPGALNAKAAYKRSYFVDWPALKAHKTALLPTLDLIIDSQRPDEPAMLSGEALRTGLTSMSHNYFRARPWFEPGPWGGQWIKRQIPSLAQDVSNYAWSFELITPENGLIFECDRWLLEVSFDWLMAYDPRAILGDAADRFGREFPIRFDFLDTVEGGNLSVQCHPRPAYIREHFGEAFTQDETYYILDCDPGARIYLGLQPGIDPAEFRAALEHSFKTATPVEIDRFVQSHPAARHDLFLIPNGTIHGAGRGSLVLEISSTPYIFTFKMYDWLRPDLDGKPRPLNIARAFDNLYFERQGSRVAEELISKPALLAEGAGWRIMRLPTHPSQFYDVHRLEFEGSIDIDTRNTCHMLSLVEGRAIMLETGEGLRQRIHYAETFVVPAAARHYRLTAEDSQPVKVIKAFVKPAAVNQLGVEKQ